MLGVQHKHNVEQQRLVARKAVFPAQHVEHRLCSRVLLANGRDQQALVALCRSHGSLGDCRDARQTA